jgi:hypothetical protein
MNQDGLSGNDLMYIPTKASNLTFKEIPAVTGSAPQPAISIAMQEAAFDAYIEQDEYLSAHRGEYAERNGHILPMLHRFDFSIAQDFNVKVAGKKNAIQVRADILNFSNLLNKDWGVSQRVMPKGNNVLIFDSVNSSGVPVYKMNTEIINGTREMYKTTFTKNSSVYDVWRAQLTLRYTFN